MPTCRRKRVVLTEPSETLIQSLRTDSNKQVFYLEQTGEIFESYEAYAARMSFYRLKHFQCEVTGKSGLNYFQAVESEFQEASTLHSRFDEALKPQILKAVQWQVMGRLDHLVEQVFERFKDRYFENEKVIVDLSGTKYYALVTKVYPPRLSSDPQSRESQRDPSVASEAVPQDEVAHQIGADLSIPAKEAYAKDDPTKYYYWVRVLELEKSGGKEPKSGKMTNSFSEVNCALMSRDRLSFSKSILRRFIRDCVDRDAAVASPWTVKPAVAERYGVKTIMPDETRQGVEKIKKGEIDKRKKVWEDKEGPPTKKQKKMTPAQEEKAKALAVVVEKKERDARDNADRVRALRDEAERIAAEKKKKKPVRYPTEDLDVRLAEKDKKAGMKARRPMPSRTLVPFQDNEGSFESFVMVWNFLVVYGQPFHISTFTLDEFQHAIQHPVSNPSCNILAETHSTLIYNLRTVPFTRHSAMLEMLEMKNRLGADHEVLGVTVDQLTGAMADYGGNWERVPLRHAEGREGWEDALVGCIKDHATSSTFPRFREILTRLLFSSASTPEQPAASTSSRMSTPLLPTTLTTQTSPTESYYSLVPADRIAILAFMCNLAISSKAVHTHMESCEEQLTALRKEKIEVNRSKKQLTEEMNSLLAETKGADTNGKTNENDGTAPDPSEGSENSDESPRPRRPKQEREASRAKVASAKQAQAEHRRLDEEVNKLERRLEAIEREFRKLLGGVRVKPLGKDRFYNRIWWFDGMGSASLMGSGGVVQYGTGRIFIQGPSEFDMELLNRRLEEDVDARRKEEEGEEGMLGSGEWAVYTELEELDEFVAWLNPKGNRELALKNTLTKWWAHIAPGIRKRQADLNLSAKLPEARRSTRQKAVVVGHDISREPYMVWTNRRAINTS